LHADAASGVIASSIISPLVQTIAAHISEVTGQPFAPRETRAVGGGCINQATVLEDGTQRYFVKINSASRHDMFAAEAAGLTAIAETATVRVPRPLCHGSAEGSAFLVLEFLPLRSADRTSGARLGEQLAAMHRSTRSDFGWDIDNTIGSTPQNNTPNANWVDFLREQRIGFQLARAAEGGYGGRLQKQGEALLSVVDRFFTDYHPMPSLLHGDLWGGNVAAIDGGKPVIFDPAVYFGDREADLAMTELFGGFSSAFYDAYREAWPLDAGYRVRRDLYNLYHVLNHLNLFGGGYGSQALQLIERLLAHAR